MNSSPFIYGKTVSNQSFTNREQEMAKLQSNLIQGVHTMIISPRRWGKSSLVEKVVTTINKKQKNHRTVLIDLYAVGTEKDFLELFTREVLKAVSEKWEERIRAAKEFFTTLVPKISLNADPFSEFSVSFDIEELKKNSDEILNLPEKLAIKKGIKLIICLDEFQNLASFPEYELLEKKMRASWQRQKHVTYCLYGSKRHMMEEIFNDSSKPFYKFGDIIVLPKIAKEKWINFITESFKLSGKKIDAEIAEQIPHAMKNHSWYVQQLAHYIWNLTKTKATKVEFNRALSEVVAANLPLFQKEIDTLSITQINVLKAVAKNESQLTSSAVMKNYELGTPNNVIKNKKLLLDKDLILEIGSNYEFADPVFELWFRKQFYNTEYVVS